MSREFALSLALHAILIVLLVLGLPDMGREISMEQLPVSFEVIAEETLTPKPAPRHLEVKPMPQPKPEPEPVHKPEVKPVEPEEKSVETKEDLPPEPEPEPKKVEEVPQLAPVPEVKPELAKAEEVPDRPIPLPRAKPQVKPDPKREEAPKEKEDFTSVLKDLKRIKEKTQSQGQIDTETNPDDEGNAGKLGDQVTVSEMDAVRIHLRKCWNVPAGVKDAQDLKVNVRVWMNPDGTVKKAEVAKDIFAQGNPLYRVAADRALNAVLDKRCNPLPFPKHKYELWKDSVITFDPKEMFG